MVLRSTWLSRALTCSAIAFSVQVLWCWRVFEPISPSAVGEYLAGLDLQHGGGNEQAISLPLSRRMLLRASGSRRIGFKHFDPSTETARHTIFSKTARPET